jgi:hypothetical protein
MRENLFRKTENLSAPLPLVTHRADHERAAASPMAAVTRSLDDVVQATGDEREPGELTEAEVGLLERIEAHVDAEIFLCDPENEIAQSDKSDIMCEVFDRVFAVMKRKGSTEFDDEDRNFMRTRVRKLTRACLPRAPAPKRRFALFDRVVCHIGGDREWAAGTVQALDEDDPSDPRTRLPYVVKIDPPNSRLVSVPDDTNECVRAEVCFGRRDGGREMSLRCLPRALRKGAQRVRRFSLGARVACAVEDASDVYSDWAAGTVSAVDAPTSGVDGEAGRVAGGIVPYAVTLDTGGTVLVHGSHTVPALATASVLSSHCGVCTGGWCVLQVLVHQDEHWLVRDLDLQPAGARIAADGTRSVARMGKRKAAGDAWESVDHVTCKVRKLVELEGSDGDSDD